MIRVPWTIPLSPHVRFDSTGLLAAQVDSFALVIEQRDQARDIAARLEAECAHLEHERDALILERDRLLDAVDLREQEEQR